MTFIIMIIAVAMERFFHWNHTRWSWLARYERWLSGKLTRLPDSIIFLLAVLPILLVISLLNSFLENVFFNIPLFIFQTALLLYCLGPVNLWVQVYRSIGTLEKEDIKQLAGQTEAAFGVSSHEHPHPQSFHQAFVRAILVAAYQRVFAVLFWFVLLGPVGAVLYRLMDLSAKQSTIKGHAKAAIVLGWLDWIPVRLFTFIFALGGHFNEVMLQWKMYWKKGYSCNNQLLAECGFAALDLMEEGRVPEKGDAEKEALSLLDRVLVISLVILSLIVLIV